MYDTKAWSVESWAVAPLFSLSTHSPKPRVPEFGCWVVWRAFYDENPPFLQGWSQGFLSAGSLSLLALVPSHLCEKTTDKLSLGKRPFKIWDLGNFLGPSQRISLVKIIHTHLKDRNQKPEKKYVHPQSIIHSEGKVASAYPRLMCSYPRWYSMCCSFPRKKKKRPAVHLLGLSYIQAEA